MLKNVGEGIVTYYWVDIEKPSDIFEDVYNFQPLPIRLGFPCHRSVYRQTLHPGRLKTMRGETSLASRVRS